jgi:hypothetical protein
MNSHLQDFLESFISKRYKKERLDSILKSEKEIPCVGWMLYIGS